MSAWRRARLMAQTCGPCSTARAQGHELTDAARDQRLFTSRRHMLDWITLQRQGRLTEARSAAPSARALDAAGLEERVIFAELLYLLGANDEALYVAEGTGAKR